MGEKSLNKNISNISDISVQSTLNFLNNSSKSLINSDSIKSAISSLRRGWDSSDESSSEDESITSEKNNTIDENNIPIKLDNKFSFKLEKESSHNHSINFSPPATPPNKQLLSSYVFAKEEPLIANKNIKVDKLLFINLLEITNVKNHIFQLIKSVDYFDKSLSELQRKLEQINNKRDNNIFIKFRNIYYSLPEESHAFMAYLIVPALVLIIPLVIANIINMIYRGKINTLETNIDKIKELNIDDHKSLISEKLSFLNSKLLNSKDEVCKNFAENIINSKIEEFNKLNENIKNISDNILNLQKQQNISEEEKISKKEEFLNQIKEYNLLKRNIWKFLKDNLMQFTSITLNNNIISLANSEREEIKEIDESEINNYTKFVSKSSSKNLSPLNVEISHTNSCGKNSINKNKGFNCKNLLSKSLGF